jgi:hypothetical protein
MRSILDDEGITHVLIENKQEVWHQWTAPVGTSEMVEWLTGQPQVAEVGIPVADMKLYQTANAATPGLGGRAGSANAAAACGSAGFRQVAVFISPDMMECLELSRALSTSRQFHAGEPVPVRLDWDLNGLPVPSVRLRIRLQHDPWLPWRAPTTTADVDRLLSDCCTWAMEGTAEPERSTLATPGSPPTDLGYGAALPLVVSGNNSRGDVRPCACQVTLPVPGDGPIGRSTVVVEVVGSDGIPWTTTAGDPYVHLLDVRVQKRLVPD